MVARERGLHRHRDILPDAPPAAPPSGAALLAAVESGVFVPARGRRLGGISRVREIRQTAARRAATPALQAGRRPPWVVRVEHIREPDPVVENFPRGSQKWAAPAGNG